MKVIISVGGRFHAFNLAQQLFKRNYLQKLITSYPKFEVKKYGLPVDKVNSIAIKELLSRVLAKFPEVLRKNYNSSYFICNLYDRLASYFVEKTDIFVGWSGFSLMSMEKAKRKDAIVVLERGSSHIVYQNEILKNEYEKFGIASELPHPKIIEKELREYQEADYISVPSSFVKKTFLERGFPEEKIIQVPYGVDLSDFKKIKKTDNVFRVVFAGGVSLRKGVHYLLQAFAELNLPNAELLLVGQFNSEMRLFFEKYKGKFNWIGPKPQKELYKYYSQGSVFVMPSLEEGMSMVQLQAMACGLPLICTTNTGGDDIIRDGIDGFVVPIRDVKALKEKILFLYRNPGVQKIMAASAQKRVSRGFTWDDYGEKIIVAYNKLLKQKKLSRQGIEIF